MTLTDLERRVLEALTANGRATLRDVAAAADLPTATVAETVQALEDRGVVTGYRPDVDYAELGAGTVAVFRVGLNQSMLPTVRRRLVAEPRLTTVYEVAGDDDVVAVGRYDDVEGVEAQRRALWAIPGVTDVSSSVVESAIRDFAPAPLPGEAATGDDGASSAPDRAEGSDSAATDGG